MEDLLKQVRVGGRRWWGEKKRNGGECGDFMHFPFENHALHTAAVRAMTRRFMVELHLTNATNLNRDRRNIKCSK